MNAEEAEVERKGLGEVRWERMRENERNEVSALVGLMPEVSLSLVIPK